MTEKTLRERSKKVLARPFPTYLRGRPGAPTRPPAVVDDSPWFFRDGHGAHLVTADGRDLLDLEMGRGPFLLGYGHPVSRDAALKCARSLPRSALLPESAVDLAEKLVELIPSAEKVVFGKNGSDACAAAVRTARAATGRQVVLANGFHGFQDWIASEYGWVEAGFPAAFRGWLKRFALNDTAALVRLAEENASDLAAIMVEPAHHTLPDVAFLETCRELADRYGAVLIFDEVVTAFRLDMHGAQGLYGVVPDLTCLGKAMGNGEAVSALAGSALAMKGLDRTYFSMTFQFDNRAFAISRDCLDFMEDGNATRLANARGESLRAAFDGAAARHGLPHRARGFGARLDLQFETLDDLPFDEQADLFAHALLQEDVLPVTTMFACAMLTDDDVAQAARAFDRGMRAVAAARRAPARA